MKADAPTLKILIALGGWDLGENKLDYVLSEKNDVSKIFLNNVVEFLENHGFNGIHLDLTYASKPGFRWNADKILALATVGGHILS